jgi:hypothetical protein
VKGFLRILWRWEAGFLEASPNGHQYNQRSGMDANLSVAIIVATTTMVTGMFGMWINASGVGKRIDEMGNRFGDLMRRFEDLRGDFKDMRGDMKDLRGEVKDLRTEFSAFKELVNGKFRDLDLELAKLMDRPK